jgi:transposase
MAANRFAWNLLAEKTSGTIFDLKLKKVVEKFRPLVQKRNISNKLAISEAPEECFDSAYRDFVKNRKTTIAQSKAKKDKTGKGFDLPKGLRFRRKKDNKDSIEIRSRKFQYFHKTKTIRLYPKYFGKNKSEIKIKTNLKKLGVKINYSCRLNRENGKYYLIIPYIRKVPQINSNKKCAIDPGGRTFLTGYDPEGSIFEIGKDTGFLRRKKQNIKKLQSKLDTEKNKRRRIKYRKIINNTYTKITNCVKDLHHKASKLLADTYKEILLPIFETSRITKKKNRRINNTAADNLLTLSHYKFRKLLTEKMENRGGKLIECTEEFTSKTCGNCGRLNHKLGPSKIFRCPYENCNVILDRDISAARNIYMKNYNLLSKN